MIHDLKPYSEYKESGVPWLGNVPKHWDLRRGKAMFRCIDVRSSTGAEELLTVSSERGVVPRRSTTVTMFKVESYVGHKLCWPGDLVINSLWAWGRGSGVSRHHGIVSSAYGVYRLRSELAGYSGFIHELVRSVPFHWELQVRSKGVWISRLQLTDDSFLSAPFPIPSHNEHAAIARFLDHADRRIRRFIVAKKKLIALLNEQKQSIIHRALTRGLDPNVRVKPSGVDWLGDVPEHWEVVPLRWYISIGSGYFIETEKVCSEATAQMPYPVIGGNGVLGYAASFNTETITVVVGRVGALCGNVHLVDRPAWITDNALRIAEIREFGAGYLAMQLRAMNLNQLANVSAQPLITGGMVKSQRVVKPPMEEQRSLVRKMNGIAGPVEAAIIRVQREIDLLREYRTRLIADVVTGKLDVREAAAHLPDEADASEPLDEADALTEDDDADPDATSEEAEG